MSDHSYVALYYPFIHFKEDRWLKLAALYWDKMCRIVPREYKTEDSETVLALGDFVKNLPPDWVKPEFGETFREFIEQNGAALACRYGVHLRGGWGWVPLEQRPPAAGGSSGTDPRLGYVFYEKMSPDVLRVLVCSGLALSDPADSRWIGMHPRLAQVYMTALADELAGEQGLYPVTSDPVDHMATGGRTIQRLAQAMLDDVELIRSDPGQGEVESVAAYLALETVVPKDIDALPVERILRFREKYPNERAAFQAYVAEFVDHRQWLHDMADSRLLEEHLSSEYDKHLSPKLEELREKLHEVNIDSVMGCLGLQVATPSLALLTASALHIAANPVLAVGAGAALAFARVLRDRRKGQRDLKSSPLAYLLRAEANLRPKQMFDRVRQAAQKFRFF